MLFFACTDPKPAESGVEIVDDSGDSATTDPQALPWAADPDFWTQPGPLAEMLFPDALFPNETHWTVRIAISEDGQTWVPDPRVIAYGFSSLHLMAVEGGVILTGVPDHREFQRQNIDLDASQIHALVSADLETWGSVAFAVQDNPEAVVIDPSLFWDQNENLQAAWFGVPSEDIDPAALAGDHPIYGAQWGQGFEALQTPLFSAPGLADPAVCRMNGEFWMFTTEEAQRVVAARSSDGLNFTRVEGFALENETVPWCREENNEITVITQNDWGRGNPKIFTVHADASVTPEGEVYSTIPWPEVDNCTAPGVLSLSGQWLIACAVNVMG